MKKKKTQSLTLRNKKKYRLGTFKCFLHSSLFQGGSSATGKQKLGHHSTRPFNHGMQPPPTPSAPASTSSLRHLLRYYVSSTLLRLQLYSILDLILFLFGWLCIWFFLCYLRCTNLCFHFDMSFVQWKCILIYYLFLVIDDCICWFVFGNLIIVSNFSGLLIL